MPPRRELSVRLGDEDAGRLVVSPDGTLIYEPTGPQHIISIAERSGRPWTPGFTRAWFEGLLPEGDLRSRAAARFDIRPDDTYAMLEAIGWECAGAVAVVPLDHDPAEAGYAVLTDDEVGQRLDALPGHPFDDDAALRMSLGGQRDKLVLARLGGAWNSTIGGVPSTHVLKPEPAAWPGLAMAEAWSLRVVAELTDAAVATVALSLASRPTLVVTRYDREVQDGRVWRTHQEDVCQILGLLPVRKYSEAPGRKGDPSYRSIAEVLRTNAADVVGQLRTLLQRMVAHVVLMDTDAHGKNASLLHDPAGYVRLSPVYDIVPTTAFVPNQHHLAMCVNGVFRIDRIERSDLVAEACSWGYPTTLAKTDVDASLDALDAGIAEADAQYPELDARARLQVTGQLFRLRRGA